MFRSLHMKLVLILVLMIISVMAVVGTFLINSVSTFYLDSFYEQMQSVFTGDTILSMEEAAAETGVDGLRTIVDEMCIRDRSQAALAQALGMYKTTYARYEQGQRDLPRQTAILIADYYRISLDELAGRKIRKG